MNPGGYGGGGWGQPPAGAPGMGAYAPPQGGYGAPPAPTAQQMMGVAAAAGPGIGQRVVFNGDGGKLLGTWLTFGLAPVAAGVIAMIVLALVGGALGSTGSGAGGVMGVLFLALGFFLLVAGALVASVLFTNKFYEFYYESLVLDGQPCQYTGTTGELAKIILINAVLSMMTCGIYSLWGSVKMKEFIYSKVLVGGQPNRLTFHGDPASLLGTYILGIILTYCTAGLYQPWFMNNIFAFMWENTKLDGRPYQFRKDAGGWLGWSTIAMNFTVLSLGIYFPWGICNVLKWEAERVA